MKFIPILFSTPMVQANKEGRKDRTRRTKGLEVINQNPDDWEVVKELHKQEFFFFSKSEEDLMYEIKCPYGQPGDILWVRETFQFSLNPNEFVYKSDTDNPIYLDKNWKWKPNIYMPKSACRIFLKVKSVRVERLQDITEQDAIAEGVLLHEKGIHYLNYFDAHHKVTQFIYNCRSAVESFKSLWILINGKRDEPFGWFRNPLVWVIEFEKVELNLRQKELFFEKIFLNEEYED